MSVDDRLEELRRAAEQNPEDKEAGAVYEAALLRAGQNDEVKARYRMKFLCPLQWEQLSSQPQSPFDRTRFCERCHEMVFWVEDERELAERTAAGQCVAFQADRLDRVMDGLVDGASRGETPQPGCLVPGQQAPLERPDLPAVRMGAPMRIPTPPLPKRGFFARLFGRGKE